MVGNKAKGRISKRVFQEDKARQIFWKTNISYPLFLFVFLRDGNLDLERANPFQSLLYFI